MSRTGWPKEFAVADCTQPPRTPSQMHSPELLRPVSGERAALDELLEALPCMAFLERGEEIFAANALARDFAGTGEAMRVDQLFAGAYPTARDGRRQLFDCRLLSPGAPSTRVRGAVQPFAAAGEGARLVLLMESGVEVAEVNQDHGGKAESTFLEDLFDSSPEAMIIVWGTHIVRANPEFLRMFGYSLAECIGADTHDLIIPDGRHHESEILLFSVLAEGRASMETVRRTRAGEQLDVSLSLARVRLGVESMGLCITFRDIRSQKETEARLQYATLHDPLTGLANRVLFLDRLTLTMARFARRPDRNYAVVFLDVDLFKQVNDSRGHAAGDALLLAVAQRLRSCLRPQDTIARFGGDEFALLLDEVGSTEDIARLAERIQRELRKPVEIGGAAVLVSASMGIALGSAGYTGSDEIMRDADSAMYRAKVNGKGRHEFFQVAAGAKSGV